MFAVIAVFVGGLMVGRTPEFLGKTIGAREVKLALIGTLVMPIGFLDLGRASRRWCTTASSRPLNAGPHGFSEILYALRLDLEQQRLGDGGHHGRDPVLRLDDGRRHAARAASR